MNNENRERLTKGIRTYLLLIVPIGDGQETLGKKDLEFPNEEIL
jgi:hypothetical protein